VNDVEWSPNTSSIFASVASDGRIEVWDLKRNNLSPILSHFDMEKDKVTKIEIPKTVVRWSKTSPVIMTGDAMGRVNVYRVNGIAHVQVSEKDQISRLLTSI